MTDVEWRMSNAEALDVTGRAHRDGSVAPTIPHERSTMSRFASTVRLAVASTRRIFERAKPQSTTPFIELHRIAFAERNTAWAASSFDPVRDRAG
jgi:hypothetical protein